MNSVKHEMRMKFLLAVQRLDELEEDANLRESRIRAAEDLLVQPAVTMDWNDVLFLNHEAMFDHRETVLHNKACAVLSILFSERF